MEISCAFFLRRTLKFKIQPHQDLKIIIRNFFHSNMSTLLPNTNQLFVMQPCGRQVYQHKGRKEIVKAQLDFGKARLPCNITQTGFNQRIKFLCLMKRAARPLSKKLNERINFFNVYERLTAALSSKNPKYSRLPPLNFQFFMCSKAGL